MSRTALVGASLLALTGAVQARAMIPGDIDLGDHPTRIEGAFEIADARFRLLGHGSVISFPGCSYPATAVADGCAFSPGGTVQMGDMFLPAGHGAQSGQIYVTRPGKDVAGVDFPVGPPPAAAATRIDATTFAWPSWCSVNKSTNDGLGRPIWAYKCGGSGTPAGATLSLINLNVSAGTVAGVAHGVVTVTINSFDPPANLIVLNVYAHQDAGCIPSTTGSAFINVPNGTLGMSTSIGSNDFYGYGDYMPSCNWVPFNGFVGPGQRWFTQYNSEQWFGGRASIIATDNSTGNLPSIVSLDNLIYGYNVGAFGNHGDGEAEIVAPSSPTGTLSYKLKAHDNVIVEPAGTWWANTAPFFPSDGGVNGNSSVTGNQYHIFDTVDISGNVAISNMTGATFKAYFSGTSMYVTQMLSNSWKVGSTTYTGGDLETISPGWIPGQGELHDASGNDLGVHETTAVSCTNTAIGACYGGIPGKEGTYTVSSSALSGTGSSSSPVTVSIVGPNMGSALFTIERDYYRHFNITYNWFDATGALGIGSCATNTPGVYNAGSVTYPGGSPFITGFNPSMLAGNVDLVTGATMKTTGNTGAEDWSYSTSGISGQPSPQSSSCDVLGVGAYQGPTS